MTSTTFLNTIIQNYNPNKDYSTDWVYTDYFRSIQYELDKRKKTRNKNNEIRLLPENYRYTIYVNEVFRYSSKTFYSEKDILLDLQKVIPKYSNDENETIIKLEKSLNQNILAYWILK